MDKVDKINKWVKERQEQLFNSKDIYYEGKYDVLTELGFFIDSLPEEKASEDLKKASEDYAYTNWESDDYHEGASEGLPFDPIGHTEKTFIAGAKWQRNSIWHDADKEQPKGYRTVVAINLSDKSGDVMTRCVSVYSGRIWAYVDDLFPIE